MCDVKNNNLSLEWSKNIWYKNIFLSKSNQVYGYWLITLL